MVRTLVARQGWVRGQVCWGGTEWSCEMEPHTCMIQRMHTALSYGCASAEMDTRRRPECSMRGWCFRFGVKFAIWRKTSSGCVPFAYTASVPPLGGSHQSNHGQALAAIHEEAENNSSVQIYWMSQAKKRATRWVGAPGHCRNEEWRWAQNLCTRRQGDYTQIPCSRKKWSRSRHYRSNTTSSMYKSNNHHDGVVYRAQGLDTDLWPNLELYSRKKLAQRVAAVACICTSACTRAQHGTHSSSSVPARDAGALELEAFDEELGDAVLVAGVTEPRICSTATRSASLRSRARFFNLVRRFSALRRSFVSFFLASLMAFCSAFKRAMESSKAS